MHTDGGVDGLCSFMADHHLRTSGAAFQKELHTWLEQSGAVRQLRTQVRTHLIAGLQRQHVIRPPDTANIGPRERALNHLILERLMNGGHWLTASVWASEAQFLSTIPVSVPPWNLTHGVEPPALPPKLNDTALDTVFRHLQLGHGVRTERFRTAYYRRQDVALLDVILEALVANVTDLDRACHETTWPSVAPPFNPPASRREPSSRPQLGHIKDNRLKQAAEESFSNHWSGSELTPALSSSSSSTSSSSSEEPEGEEAIPPAVVSRIQSLEVELAQARQEIDNLRRSPAPVAELQALVDTQTREFNQIRQQLATFGVSESNPGSGTPQSTSVLDFLAASRQKVDELYRAGLAIDRETCQKK